MLYRCEHKVLAKELNEKLFLERIPLSGGIELTSRCNFQCVHCYETSDRNGKYLSTTRLLEIIDECISMGVISLFLTGGEAMLREDFDYIYKYIRQQGVLVAILSNGTSITEEKCKLFQQYMPKMIDISIYGASENTYYKVTKGRENYYKFRNGLNLLKKYGIPFQLKTVLLEENVNDLDGMRRIAEELNVPFKFYTHIRPYNDGNREPVEHMLSNETILEIEKNDFYIQEYYKEKRNNTLSKRQNEKKKYLCRIAQNGFFITYDGILNGCVRSRKNGYDLKKGTFKEGWEYLEEKFVLPKAEKDFSCANCHIVKYCDFCPGEFEIDTGNPMIAPDNICKIAHQRYEVFKEKLIGEN